MPTIYRIFILAVELNSGYFFGDVVKSQVHARRTRSVFHSFDKSFCNSWSMSKLLYIDDETSRCGQRKGEHATM